MSKFFKILAVLVLLVVVVLGAGAAYLNHYISGAGLKSQIEAQALKATGRSLSIGGDLKLTLFPNIGVTVSDVRFANAAGFAAKDMVALDDLVVQVALMPLLEKKVELKKFILKKPVINLEVDESGQGNWVLDLPKKEKTETVETASSSKPAINMHDISVDIIEIQDAVFSYVDRSKGLSEKVEGVDVKLKMPDIKGPADLNISFKYKGEVFDIQSNIGNVHDAVTMKPIDVKLDLKSKLVQKTFSGKIDPSKKDVFVSGQYDIAVPSIAAVQEFMGQTSGDLPVDRVETNGKVTVYPDQSVFLNIMGLKAGDIEAKGGIKYESREIRPYIEATLSTNKIDLDKMFPSAENPEKKKVKAAPQSNEWSKDKIDLSGLKAVDAMFSLDLAGLRVKKTDIGAFSVVIKILNGNLAAETTEVPVLDGVVKTEAMVQTSSAVPEVRVKKTVKGINAEKALMQFADFAKLSGTGNVDVDLRMKGSSVHDFVNSLNGQVKTQFLDGVVKGIDLTSMENNIRTMVFNGEAVDGAQTKFAELSASFNISNGVATNKDFKLEAPLVRATGNGTINLPKLVVNYRVTPEIVVRQKGEEEGAVIERSLGVPLVIKGTFNNVEIKPDVKSMTKDVLKNPEAVKEKLKGAEDAIKSLGEGGEEGLKNAEDAIKGLLKGF